MQQISHRSALNRIIRTAPVSPKIYRGGNPALGWVRHSASPTLATMQPDSPGVVRQQRQGPGAPSLPWAARR